MTKAYAKVRVGTGNKSNTVRFWMEGAPKEILEKINSRFKTYSERPSRKAETANKNASRADGQVTSTKAPVGATV